MIRPVRVKVGCWQNGYSASKIIEHNILRNLDFFLSLWYQSGFPSELRSRYFSDTNHIELILTIGGR